MSAITLRWTVNDLANVLTQYDTQKVYRSAVPDPYSWVEVTGLATRVALVPNQFAYVYDDAGGSETDYYAVAFYNSVSLAESDKSNVIQGGSGGLARILTLVDLYEQVGSNRVRQLLDDDLSGNLYLEGAAADRILAQAEGEAYARMMRAYGSKDSIDLLAGGDPTFRGHIAWIALEILTERRHEFLAADGTGRYQKQYDRAIAYFEQLSKGQLRSPGEAQAGQGANTGGIIEPARANGDGPRFVFAPDRRFPTGHGGF